MLKLNKIVNYSAKLVVCALLLFIVNAVIDSPKASAVINAESSPTTDYNREVGERPSYACGDGTYTRFQKTFNTGAGDYAFYYDSSIGAFRGRGKSLTIDVRSGYYVCPGTTYRNGSSQHLRIATATGQQSAATMAGISGTDAGTITRGKVNSGSDSGWASHGIYTLSLQQGWNTISFNFQTDTYVIMPSNNKSYIANISPKVVYIYVDTYPFGNNDSLNCNNTWGWAFDPDNTATSINVHMYIDGGFVTSATANQPRADVNTAYNITGNHGYSINIPSSYMNGQTHTVAVYAINIGTGSGNPYIGGGTFNCTEIQGRVFDHATDVGYANVQIGTCNAGIGNQVTDASGNFRFRASQFAGFCLAVIGGAPGNIITGPRVRPWGYQYGEQCKASFGASKTTPLVPPVTGTNYCSQTRYDWQVAGGNCHNNSTYCGAGKVGGDNNVITHDRNSDSGNDFIYITDIKLDGVKIDDSKVSTTGTTTPAWGGNCYVTNGASTNCTGTQNITSWPFSDDCVQIDGGACQTLNSFAFSGITPGNHDVSISPAGTDNGSTWVVRGYSICQNGASCTTQWLTDTDNITSASSFTFNFVASKTYHMRLIYKRPPVTCTPTPVSVAYNTPQTFTATGGNGTYSWTAQNGSPAGPLAGASFTTQWGAVYVNTTKTVTVTSNSVSATCTVTVTPPPTYPYFRTYNGDLMTGSGFTSGATCNRNASAGILAFNNGATNGVGGAGAGTQLAAFAYNKIYGFSSADMRSGATAPNPVAGLTFSNTTGEATYRGSFGDAPCMMDYATATSGTTLPNDYTLTKPSAPYNIISTGLTPDVNSREVIRVTGDIVFTGSATEAANVIYDDNGSGNWTSISQIPSLYVIAVGGDIYIDHHVNRLDGVYIAQPLDKNNDGDFNDPGEGGTIYDCTDNGTFIAPVNFVNNCRTNGNLVVNGAFIAKTIKLLRTKGDYLTTSAVNESADADIAEIFNYTPEMFLVPSPFTKKAPYQSITNLPPVL